MSKYHGDVDKHFGEAFRPKPVSLQAGGRADPRETA